MYAEDDHGLIARLARRRVFTPQTLDILTELFSARIIDPRVLSTKALVEALLDRVPVTGYKPVAGGALDLQQACRSQGSEGQ